MLQTQTFEFDDGSKVQVLPPRAAKIEILYGADKDAFALFETASSEDREQLIKAHHHFCTLVVGEALRASGRDTSEISGGELSHLLLLCRVVMLDDWGTEMVKLRLGAELAGRLIVTTEPPA